METPFLDQLIEEHQNHIESVEASSYAGIQETRKQLAELEAIKAITVTRSRTTLPSKEEIGVEIKRQLQEINKDKPVPSTKHDLGFCNGFLECYDFIKK